MAIYDIYERLDAGEAHDVVRLDHLQRERGRLKAQTESGDELRLFLDRGKTLAIHERLRSDCGRVFSVEGAIETVTRAETEDAHLFARACYHLGNRHVKLQIGDGWLRITPDHVLEEMLQLLGLATRQEEVVFVPESGAYGGGHGHSH